MGMFDYDPSTPGIQGPPGVTVASDGSVDLVGNDIYKEARNRRFTYRKGLSGDDLINFIKRGVGGNHSHAGNIFNDMLEAWDRGNEGGYGHYTGRLMTSNLFDEATQLADIMGSLYKDGYSREDIMGMVNTGKGIGDPNTNYTPSFDNSGGGSNPNPAGGNNNPANNPPANNPPPNAGVTPRQRRERLGTWGSGYQKGGYERKDFLAPKMFSSENEQMRQTLKTALEKKLLG